MIARPRVVRGLCNHLCTHRIELDIALAGPQVVFRIHETRPKAPLPQCADASVLPIEMLHIALAKVLHESRRTTGVARSEEQVNVIRHQYVSVNTAPVRL